MEEQKAIIEELCEVLDGALAYAQHRFECWRIAMKDDKCTCGVEQMIKRAQIAKREAGWVIDD